jgi:hypothetical protein
MFRVRNLTMLALAASAPWMPPVLNFPSQINDLLGLNFSAKRILLRSWLKKSGTQTEARNWSRN